MNREMLLIAEQLRDAYEGEPWFGRNMKELLNEIDESLVFEQVNGQHSILQLLWHMITWNEFTLSRFRRDPDTTLLHFEKKDWRQLDHADKSLWRQGLQRFSELHHQLVDVLAQQKDELLSQRVEERNYTFRKLLYGILQHDIYHLGQMVFLKKMLQNKGSVTGTN